MFSWSLQFVSPAIVGQAGKPPAGPASELRSSVILEAIPEQPVGQFFQGHAPEAAGDSPMATRKLTRLGGIPLASRSGESPLAVA